MVRSAAMILVWVVGALVVGAVVGLVLVKRMQTGRWEMPDGRVLVQAAQRVTGQEPPVSRVIFLDRGARELAAGDDDAPRGVSSVIRHQGTAPRKVPGWKGSAKAWTQMVTCVRDVFAPFAVEVTDERPATDEFILVAVGGKPSDIGVTDRGVGGLAPFSGEKIPRAVVFAFAATMGHRPQTVCETIAMEVAHAYGLDHAYLCSDVMSYLKPCGRRGFVDKEVPCGEKKKRVCAGGAPMQNSYRKLVDVVGLRR